MMKATSTRKGSTPAKSVASFKKAARQEKRAAKDMSRASYDEKKGRPGKAAENKMFAKKQEKRAGHNIAKALHAATKPVRKGK